MPTISLRHRRGIVALQTLGGTVYLALLISLSNRGGWKGYGAGLGDHTVLMPQGIQWAVPGAFKNDWFMQAAPQPHWFFDLVVAAGTKLGAVDAILLAYWLLGLVAFSLGTFLLAKLIAPARPVVTSFLVLTLAGITPWMLFGTGTGFIGMALPTVTAANMIYLVFVLLLRGSLKSATVLGVLVAVVHVQQGAIIAIVFAATIALQFILSRKVLWSLLVGMVLSAGLVLFGLRLRPVAANLSDFVEVCNSVIPYHCASHTWDLSLQLATVGALVLAGLTAYAFQARLRTIWATTIGLVILGLGLGFAADALTIPVLGQLAQAVNVYRLGSVVVPFLIWGLLLPVILPQAFTKMSEVNRVRNLSLWLVWAFALMLTLLDPSWGIRELIREHTGFAILIAVVLAGAVVAAWIRKRDLVSCVVGFAVLAGLLSGGIAAGTLVGTPHFNFYKWGNSESRNWMEAVGEAVPEGGVIMAPGSSESMRLYSQRATIVDCKNIPYGGEAWRDWLTRSRDIGVCGSPISYEAFTSDELQVLAKKYGSEFVVLTSDMYKSIGKNLEAQGWRELVGPDHDAGDLRLYAIPNSEQGN